MQKFICYLSLLLVGSIFLSACSRPVAYFQRGSNELYNSSFVQKAPSRMLDSVRITTSDVRQVDTPVRSAEVYAQVTTQPVINKSLQSLGHPARIAATDSEYQRGSTAQANRKLNGFERFLVKKLNKRITRQLAPQRAENAKAVFNTGFLIGGAVLLIGGLILLIAGTGTVAFIGLIVSLVGALGVILGLFGQ